MKKETITILLFSICAFHVLANNIADPFWQQTFNNSFPTGWSVGDMSNQGVLWARCDNPNECVPAIFSDLFCSDAQFRSTSFEDGYMYVNSYSHGPLAMPSQSYLRTETIDCTDKSAVFIKFETYIHAIYKDPDINAVLRVRSGNGSWDTFTIFPTLNFQIMENLQSWNAQPVLLDISSAAANKPNVTIEWLWTANFDVAWMVDDISLFDENPQNQNVVWGQIAGQGDFSGGMNGWTVPNQVDECKWTWTTSNVIELSDNNPKADAYACWSGVANGAMIMNSSYCNRYMTNGTPYSRSRLKSPIINLSTLSVGINLDLKFDQVVAVANRAEVGLPITSIAVSIDNGVSFIDTIDVNPIQPYLHGKCEEVRFRLPSEVAGKPQVRLIFIYAGDTHYWMIDNVRITLADDRDVQVNAEFFSVARDFSVPSNQVQPISLIAQVKNTGNLPMSNVKVYANVKNFAGNIVFTDSVEVGTLDADNTWNDVHFPERFLPSDQPDEYTIWYETRSDDEDGFVSNDKVHWNYKVTENTYSKNEFCATSNGYFFSTESYKYEIGNCYYIPKGSKLLAKSMSFAFANVTKLATGNAQLTIKLYEWRNGDNSGDVNNDTMANDNEYTEIAYNVYEIDGSEGGSVVTIPISGEVDSVMLKDSTYYFVTVGYLAPVTVSGVVQPFPIAGSEEINYGSMFYNSYSDGIPGYTSMLSEDDDKNFRANAWALRRIPFVNLNVEQLVNATNQTVEFRKSLKIFPNPSNGQVLLTADFLNVNQPVQVEIFDLCGRMVMHKEFLKGIVSQLPIDVSALGNGSYNLRVISGRNLASTKLMVIQ